jgi:hypothetical protein
MFSEKNARAEARRYRRKGVDATSRRIADLLKERGVEGKMLLEVGGGIGAIANESSHQERDSPSAAASTQPSEKAAG